VIAVTTEAKIVDGFRSQICQELPFYLAHLPAPSASCAVSVAFPRVLAERNFVAQFAGQWRILRVTNAL
jgi:hypothetical protein